MRRLYRLYLVPTTRTLSLSLVSLRRSLASFTDLFFSEFIAGLSDEATLGHYDLLVAAAPPDSKAEKELYERWVQGGKVDGIIINRVRLSDWRLHFLSRQNVPHVSLERSISRLEFIGIEVDSLNGMLELMSHLVGRGHRRVAYIGGVSDLKIDRDRFAGYEAGLNAAGIGYDPELIVQSNMTSEGGYRAAQHLLDLTNRPTAIACINDLTAIGTMHAAHERGLVIGRDLAVAGFDGIADAAHTEPPLTTLEQPIYTVARQLTHMLLAIILGNPSENKQVKIQPKLIIRSSTGG